MQKVLTALIGLSAIVTLVVISSGSLSRDKFHLEEINPFDSYEKAVSRIMSDDVTLYDRIDLNEYSLSSYRNNKSKINIEISHDKNGRIVYAREFSNGSFLGDEEGASVDAMYSEVELTKDKYGEPSDYIDFVDENNIERKIWQWKLEKHKSVFELHVYKKRGRDSGYSYLKTLATPLGGQGFIENMEVIRNKLVFLESMKAHNREAPVKPDKL